MTREFVQGVEGAVHFVLGEDFGLETGEVLAENQVVVAAVGEEECLELGVGDRDTLGDEVGEEYVDSGRGGEAVEEVVEGERVEGGGKFGAQGFGCWVGGMGGVVGDLKVVGRGGFDWWDW